MLAREPGELAQRRARSRVIELTPSIAISAGVTGSTAAARRDGRGRRGGTAARSRRVRAAISAVVDRLVGAAVEEDRPLPASTGMTDMWMWVIVGSSSVSSQPRSSVTLRLDLLVEHRAAEKAGPARVGAPSRQVLRHRVDDLLVEVEAEVVARREVGEPVVADADPAAVLLVDHGVEHRMRVLQLARGRRRSPSSDRATCRSGAEAAAARSSRSRPCRSRADVGHQTSEERARMRGGRAQPAAWNPYRPNGRGALHLQGGISDYQRSTDAARSPGASERLCPAGGGVPRLGDTKGIDPLGTGREAGRVRCRRCRRSGSMHLMSSCPRPASSRRPAAEAAGFQAAMCSDHLAPWSERQGHSGHAWSWLGAAMQATERALRRGDGARPAIPPGDDRQAIAR